MKNSNKKNSLPIEFPVQDFGKLLNPPTLERKKKEGGVFEYFVADYDGKFVEKLPEKYINGRQLGDGFYEFTYYDNTLTSESIMNVISNHDIREVVETKGDKECELKAIFSQEGVLIMEGIRNIIIFYSGKKEFILELEPLFHLEKAEESIKKGRSTGTDLGIMDKPLRCVMNSDGEFVVEPTTRRIRFDRDSNNYVLLD